jgi:hypothetical protein
VNAHCATYEILNAKLQLLSGGIDRPEAANEPSAQFYPGYSTVPLRSVKYDESRDGWQHAAKLPPSQEWLL